MRCVDLYNQTQSKWFEEMVTTCMVKTLKHDRAQKTNLSQYNHKKISVNVYILFVFVAI